MTPSADTSQTAMPVPATRGQLGVPFDGRKIYTDAGSRMLRSFRRSDAGNVSSATIYKHFEMDLYSFVQPETEVIINLSGSANFRRKADGPEQEFTSRPGSISICPAGADIRYLHINSGPIDLLHVALPCDLFGPLIRADGNAHDDGIEYLGGIHDPVIQSIGFAISELVVDQVDDCTKLLMLDSYAYALATRLLQRYTRRNLHRTSRSAELSQSTSGLDETRLRRVLEYIRENVAEELTLEDLANVACLSVFHFCRAFKASTSSTPFEFVSNVRIQVAKDLLLNRHNSIEDVAHFVGFSGGASFARAFKKIVGASPSQYRGANGL
jgi:AraC family transcriptional regulator